MEEKLLEYLFGFISENKKNLFLKNIEDRTKYMTIVLEDIYQPHNASAVLRSCDCFGIQDVHVIENKNFFEEKKDVALGSSKWVSVHRYNQTKNNTLDCINKLKKDGYRIVGTSPHVKSCALEEFDIAKGKFALVFGSEEPGMTSEAIENCDELINIPMLGFTESFNISVSAAICLHHLRWKINSSETPYKLNDSEKTEIMIAWTKQVIKSSEMIEKLFFENMRNNIDNKK